MDDAPASKRADDLEALMGAIDRLQNVVRSMGPHAKVAEIRLVPGDGRHEVERAVKASPSYLKIAWFPDPAHTQPFDVLFQVMGVKVIAER